MTAKHLRYACWLMVVVLMTTAAGLSACAFQLAQSAQSEASPDDQSPDDVLAPSSAYVGPIAQPLADPAAPRDAGKPTLESEISQALRSTPLLDYSYSSHSQDGALHLQATVSSEAKKALFQAIVRNVPGAEGVRVQIQVDPSSGPQPSGLQPAPGEAAAPAEPPRSQQEVAQAISTLLRCNALRDYSLSIRFEDGICTLRGRVSNEPQRQLLAALAQAIPGRVAEVQRVEVDVKVEPAPLQPAPLQPGPASQDELNGGQGDDRLAQLPTAAAQESAKAPAETKAEKPAPADPEAERILDQAAKNLASIDWVRAGIRQRVDLFGKRLDGTGTYLKGPHWKMKLELKIALDDRRPPSSMQQICDGRWLYDHREVLGSRMLTKVDVTAVRDALERGPARPGIPSANSLLGLGGLEQLLRGLRAQFEFQTSGMMKVGDRSFIALRGHWQRDVLLRMLPGQRKNIEAGKPIDYAKLPEYVPDEVLLLLDPKTLFLHRVEYRRTDPEADTKGDPADAKSKNRLTGKSLIIMELYDVELGQPVDDLNFLYKSDLPAVDRTEEYLRMLRGEDPAKADKEKEKDKEKK